MQLFFDHVAGKTQEYEIIHSPVSAIFERDQFDYALQNGWLITSTWYNPNCSWFRKCKESGTPVWYQSRTARLKPSDYVFKKRHRKLLNKDNNLSYKLYDSFDVATMIKIYNLYLNARGFVDMYGADHPFAKSDYGDDRITIVFYHFKKPVAFSLLDVVNNSVVATQFSWDYASPELNLGKISYYVEQQVAQNSGFDYIYLGSSYECSALSKSNYAGFEWWTGRAWSKDIELYKKLTTNESNIKTIDDLYNQQVMFYDHLDI